MSTAIPSELVTSIRAGECVAFVGAGFSAAVIPTWKDLLLKVVERSAELPEDDAQRIRKLLRDDEPNALEYEAAAQTLERGLSREHFLAAVRECINASVHHADAARREATERRVRLLRGIPFRAILTTNFDSVLEGGTPLGSDAYRSLLRPESSRWWQDRYWDPGASETGAPIVKLHGDLYADPPDDIILTRQDYRRRIVGDAAYMTFLRSVFATSTVLYLGFSFTDAYLNELRAEILEVLGVAGKTREDRIAYALLPGDRPEKIEYFQAFEGIETMPYPLGDGANAHAGFDDFLDVLHAETNTGAVLGRHLRGKTVLWIDPWPTNNEYGLDVIQRAAKDPSSDEGGVHTVGRVDEALAFLEQHGPVDLILTHWGHAGGKRSDGSTCTVAEELLERIPTEHRAPVIVFASMKHANENKPRALRAGAVSYVFFWSSLMREIHDVFAAGRVTG